MINFCLQPLCKTPTSTVFSSFLGYPQNYLNRNPYRKRRDSKWCSGRRSFRERKRGINCGFLPVDPWAPTNIDSQSIASQLFAASLFPYLGFLYFITKSKSAPKLTLFGFYFLLVFVGATTKVNYGTNLANVDWLHGGAESLLTLTNLFIVMGLMGALRKTKDANESTTEVVSATKEDNKSR
ncbi:Protein of unknown function DUF3593 [Macleaya cordata]|uniref:DUF3593 domain-containing protein n=1 Tax=Macleaya cordata TaxID=56857 RepID=A0A200PUQ2_MACCD|nr:Protein of unknown function DUF3593 [Macleaya cordata]